VFVCYFKNQVMSHEVKSHQCEVMRHHARGTGYELARGRIQGICKLKSKPKSTSIEHRHHTSIQHHGAGPGAPYILTVVRDTVQTALRRMCMRISRVQRKHTWVNKPPNPAILQF
jgi:hypothetical protein